MDLKEGGDRNAQYNIIYTPAYLLSSPSLYTRCTSAVTANSTPTTILPLKSMKTAAFTRSRLSNVIFVTIPRTYGHD